MGEFAADPGAGDPEQVLDLLHVGQRLTHMGVADDLGEGRPALDQIAPDDLLTGRPYRLRDPGLCPVGVGIPQPTDDALDLPSTTDGPGSPGSSAS